MDRAKLLVADDDDVTLAMLEAVLEADHEVVLARSGAEALRLAQANTPDLALLDVDMPDMDGYQLCERLKGSPQTAQVPVLFLSACTSIEERLRGYRVGAADYLTKPFDTAELQAKISRVVEQRRQQAGLLCQLRQAMLQARAAAHQNGEMEHLLAWQHTLMGCHQYTALADAAVAAVARLGHDACVRLRGTLGVLSRGPLSDCSALESSILDHIETSEGPTVQAVGSEHSSFNLGAVILLVRQLPATSPATGTLQAERHARVLHQIHLIAHGVAARLKNLDSAGHPPPPGPGVALQETVQEALSDMVANQQTCRIQLEDVFERLGEALDRVTMSLGLSHEQEELVQDTLTRYVAEARVLMDEHMGLTPQVQKVRHALQQRSS